MILRQNFISKLLMAILFVICLDESSSQPFGYSYKELNPNQPILQPISPKVLSNNSVKQTIQRLPVKPAGVALPVQNNNIILADAPKPKPLENHNWWKASPKAQPPQSPQPIQPPHPVQQPPQPVQLANPGVIHSWEAAPPRMSDDPAKKKIKKPQRRRLNDSPKKRKGLRKQNDDDDDDDDDGGEYEGADSGGQDSHGKKSMPMMIIRGFDVMAMDVPVLGGQCSQPPPTQAAEVEVQGPDEGEEQVGAEPPPPPELPPEGESEQEPETTKSCSTLPPMPTTEECRFDEDMRMNDIGFANDMPMMDVPAMSKDDSWGAWSSCSASCGVGQQTRSRLHPTGQPELDTETRACQLAECPEARRYEASQQVAPQYVDLAKV